MNTVSLSLPFPPSVNHYWMSLRRGPLAGRVIISGAGKRYRNEVIARVVVPRGWDATARIGVAITAYPPDRRRRDIDNLLKPLLDSLQHAHAFVDDCQIDDLRIVRGEVIEEGMVDVVIQRLSQGRPHRSVKEPEHHDEGADGVEDFAEPFDHAEAGG